MGHKTTSDGGKGMRGIGTSAIFEPKVLLAPLFHDVVVELSLRNLVLCSFNMLSFDCIVHEFAFFLVSAQVTENFRALHVRESIKISQ